MALQLIQQNIFSILNTFTEIPSEGTRQLTVFWYSLIFFSNKLAVRFNRNPPEGGYWIQRPNAMPPDEWQVMKVTTMAQLKKYMSGNIWSSHDKTRKWMHVLMFWSPWLGQKHLQ